MASGGDGPACEHDGGNLLSGRAPPSLSPGARAKRISGKPLMERERRARHGSGLLGASRVSGLLNRPRRVSPRESYQIGGGEVNARVARMKRMDTHGPGARPRAGLSCGVRGFGFSLGSQGVSGDVVGTGCPSPRAPVQTLLLPAHCCVTEPTLDGSPCAALMERPTTCPTTTCRKQTYHRPYHPLPEKNPLCSPTTRSRDSIRDAAPPTHATHGSIVVPRSTALHLRSNNGPLPDGRVSGSGPS